MNTKKTNGEKKPSETQSSFPCGDFQKMAEMMKNCCPDGGDTIDCCSMMKRMMERGKRGKSKKAEETQKPPEDVKNG